MLDTLLLVASLAHPPVSRPMRMVTLNDSMIHVPALPLSRPESLTTCHESSVGSCWTDK